MADAVATTLARNRGGIPAGYQIDPVSGQLVPITHSLPTMGGTTNFNQQPTTGTQPNGDYIDDNGDVWRLVENQWLKGQKDPLTGQVRFSNGPIQEIKAREGVLPANAPAGSDPGEYWRSGAGDDLINHVQGQGKTLPAGTGASNPMGAYNDLMNDTSRTDAYNTQNNNWQGLLGQLGAQASQDRKDQISRQQGYDTTAITDINRLVGQQQGYVNDANARTNQLASDYTSQLQGYKTQNQGYYNNYMGETNGLMNPVSGVDYGANVQADPYGSGLQSQSYNQLSGIGGGSLDYSAQLASLAQAAAVRAQLTEAHSNPEEVERQNYAIQQIKNDLDGPEYQEQLNALRNINTDIERGGVQQQRTLDDILNDVQNGSSGQQDGLNRILEQMTIGNQRADASRYWIGKAQEEGGGRYEHLLGLLNNDLTNGGTEQRAAMEKLKGLSDPEITAQERYIAGNARQQFEDQDRGIREATDQELQLRGLRSGSAVVGSALGAQERTGRDRVQAELGLQASAQQRALQALGGWSTAANQLRSSDQQSLGLLDQATGQYNNFTLQGAGLYADATNAQNQFGLNAAGAYASQTNAIRAAQQQGLAMANNAANELRAAQQRGLALSAQQTNALRAAQQQGLAMYYDATAQMRQQGDNMNMFNAGQANDMSMFNAGNETNVNMFNAGQSNQVGMFNAGQQNQASANNQQTRLGGSIAAGNMANQIRSDNDAINTFNKAQSQITARFNSGLASQEASRIGGLAGQRYDAGMGLSSTNAGLDTTAFNANTGANNTTFERNSGQTGLGIGAAGTILGINTQTNGLQGAAGQQDFMNGLQGFGAFQSGAGVSNNLSAADQQRQASALALAELTRRGGAPRMS